MSTGSRAHIGRNKAKILSILKRLPRAERLAKFQYVGWFFGCPVYIADAGSEAPHLWVRNWVPDWLAEVSLAVWGFCAWCCCTMDPDYVPMFPLRITGRVDGQPFTDADHRLLTQ